MLNRREFSFGLFGAASLGASKGEKLPPVRAITRGPKFHYFGYYGRRQFDPSSRYALALQVDFEHRLQRESDVAKLGMVDLQDNDAWIELGETRTFSWQQGCMAEWLPGSKSEIIWNDRQDGRFVCHILDVNTRKKRTLPSPYYSLSPDGRWALVTDFARLNHVRPETGYAGVSDPNKDLLAPGNSGIWRMDMQTGKLELLFSDADVVKIPYPDRDSPGVVHWLTHVVPSPDGSRFGLIHSWRRRGATSFSERLLTARSDGKELRLFDPYGKTSHYTWRDSHHLLVWCWRPSHGSKFYLIDDVRGTVNVFAPEVMTENGHASFLPGNRCILSDTAPDQERNQHPYLYDTRTGKRHPLGHFYSPPAYTGVLRCDTHPRFSPDGRTVTIDSPHGGNGRQIYLIDISELTGQHIASGVAPSSFEAVNERSHNSNLR